MTGARSMKFVGVLTLITLLLAAAPPSPLADAAMRGDRVLVRSLLAKGADVNAPQGDGMTALHWASARGDVELADLLVRAGAKLEAVTRNGAYTPLHLASKAGYAPVVRRLLKAGSNIKAITTTGGVSALHLAAGAGSADAVTALLERGSDPNVRETGWGQTPLIFAAAYNRVEVVKVLLKRGAHVAITTTVLDLPARDAVDRTAGQRRNQTLNAFRKQSSDSQTWRPSSAQVQAAVSAAQQVQKAGATAEVAEADPDPSGGEEVAGYSGLVGSQGGLTALLHAVREGHKEATALLLNAGADINQVSAGDHTSPLLLATINGHFDLAAQLLQKGANPNLASDAGATPLFAAINTQWAPKSRYPQQLAHMLQKATYLDLMKALLAAGANPNVRLKKHIWYMSYTFDLLDVDTRGATPFWRAAYATDVDAMRLLVASGADSKIATLKTPDRPRRGGGRGDAASARQDPSGLPPVPPDGPAVWPIHAASGVGYGEGYAANAHRHVPGGWLPAVKYLVEELGADVNARDLNGYNALHHAAARGDNELIHYLVQKGADVTAVSRKGQTTADMANGPVQRISPFPQTVALLEKLGSKNNRRCMSC
ncbi:MAG: ankyrin repeat domain-containing protein [Longimicrobiales bacterium]